MSEIPELARESVFKRSVFDTSTATQVKGIDFSGEVSIDSLAQAMLTTGFQATNLGLAVNEINRMLDWRLSDRPIKEDEPEAHKSMEYRREQKCRIFLSYTSNMMSCGVRETLKFLVKNKMVSAIITTAGGVEEDFIKCLAPFYLGDFKLKGSDLRRDGMNRTGNLLVPNDNYCMFEEWIEPILETMADEQVNDGMRWTPSEFIRRLGKEINNEDSVYYWAYKNDIPVFCPALQDGSIGDMLYFNTYKRPEFYLDVVNDVRRLNDMTIGAHCSGMVILGGGIVKHHNCNANMMRNGADYAVYINTGHEFDGSDAGASPDEAVSWGKIRVEARPVKLSCDASLVFPLIVSQTFYKAYQAQQRLLSPSVENPAKSQLKAGLAKKNGTDGTDDDHTDDSDVDFDERKQ